MGDALVLAGDRPVRRVGLAWPHRLAGRGFRLVLPVGDEEVGIVEVDDPRVAVVRAEVVEVRPPSARRGVVRRTLARPVDERLDLGAAQHEQVVPIAVAGDEQTGVGLIVGLRRIAEPGPVAHDRLTGHDVEVDVPLRPRERRVLLARDRVGVDRLPGHGIHDGVAIRIERGRALRGGDQVELRVGQDVVVEGPVVLGLAGGGVDRGKARDRARRAPDRHRVPDLPGDLCDEEPALVLRVRERLGGSGELEALEQRQDDEREQHGGDRHDGQQLDQGEGLPFHRVSSARR